MLRNRQVLLPYLLLVAAVIGGVLWYESEKVPGLGRVVSTGQADVGGPFQLTDQHGKPVSDQAFRGRYMLIYFGYSFCPDVCPTTLAVMAQALEKLGGKSSQVVPVFITIDPERDTPHICGPDRQFGPDQNGRKALPRLCREEAAGRRQLRHGPFLGDLSDGPGRQDGELLR
jgi:protein SCO1/2